MKKLMLALCLATLGVACKASGANMHDSSCTGPDCADCTKEKMEDCTDCSDAKASECTGDAAQVCPVTGKSMN